MVIKQLSPGVARVFWKGEQLCIFKVLCENCLKSQFMTFQAQPGLTFQCFMNGVLPKFSKYVGYQS